MTHNAFAPCVELRPASTQTHFWVASYPFFETTLFISAPPVHAAEASSTLSLFDPDGALINEVLVSFQPGSVGVVELDPLMGSCKLESGIKQAHLLVSSPFTARHECRIHSRGGASLLGPAHSISDQKSGFFPITFAAGRTSLLCLVSHSHETARARCRLFCGKRTPEALITVPPMGARTIVLDDQFPEYADLEEGKQLQAYVRLSAKEETVALGAQLIERIETADNEVFTSIGC